MTSKNDIMNEQLKVTDKMNEAVRNVYLDLDAEVDSLQSVEFSESSAGGCSLIAVSSDGCQTHSLYSVNDVDHDKTSLSIAQKFISSIKRLLIGQN